MGAMTRFLPAVLLSFSCLLLPLPWAAPAVLASLGLHLAAAAHRAGFLDEEALLETLRARVGGFLLMLIAGFVLGSILVAPALYFMVNGSHIYAPLLVAFGSLLLLWGYVRFWALPGLLFVWVDARQGSGESAFLVLRRTARLAWRLGARGTEALALGLPTLFALALLLALPFAALWWDATLAVRLMLAAAVSVVVCPLLAVTVLKLAASALFEATPNEFVAPTEMPMPSEHDAPLPLEPVEPIMQIPEPSSEQAALEEEEVVPVLDVRDAVIPQTPEPERLPPPAAPDLLELLGRPVALADALALGLNSDTERCAAAHTAVAHDQLDALPALKQAGWNPAQLSVDGESLIERALRASSGATIKALLGSVFTDAMLDQGREPALVAALLSKRHDLPNVVRLLVKHGADPRLPGSDGQDAVTLAVKRDMSELLPFLLRDSARPSRAPAKRANDDAREIDLIGLAQRGDVPRMIDALKSIAGGELKTEVATTALIHAAGRGHRTIVELMTTAGVDPLARLANGSCAFSAAALAGHADVVGLLLRLGCEVDTPLTAGASALLLAASRWRYATVSNLLRAGANPSWSSAGEFTALAAAAAFVHHARSPTGGRETLQVLIKAGANVSQANADGHTAVMLLVGAGQKIANVGSEELIQELLRVLLSAGAGVNQVDARGQTAVHFTAMHGLVGAAALLVKARAALRVADMQGYFPIDLAHHHGHPQYVAWLVQQGADH